MFGNDPIDAIELPPLRAIAETGEGDPAPTAGREEAQINQGILQAFDRAVAVQAREDVTNSILFAQLAADYKIDRRQQPADWAKRFFEVLATLGWVGQSLANDSATLRGSPDWPSLLVNRLSVDAQPLARTSLEAAMDLEPAGKAMRLWNATIAGPAGSSFLVAPTLDSKGSITVALVMASFPTDVEKPAFLGWELTYPTSFLMGTMELNETIYAQVRQTVLTKLGERVRTLIAPVPLRETVIAA
ncbi:hypothetical protein [Sphingomonas azotifigens]|uniref:hypothetical protein n=1 Tax=Sphingomonas azotifigens TaxID=330920 RepID=UPI000A0369EB|nr:hypothetical protein [Sphingomonas azotifigens]